MSRILKIAAAALVAIAVTACQTDNSYRLGDGELHESGAEIDPFDSANSPG